MLFRSQITGKLEGLPRKVTNGGIHVHSGKDCTNGGATDASAVNAHVGGHLFSNYIDGWAYPAPTTYNTDADGTATIVVKAKHYTLSKDKGTDAVPSVEGRCIVLHGLSAAIWRLESPSAKSLKAGIPTLQPSGGIPAPMPSLRSQLASSLSQLVTGMWSNCQVSSQGWGKI